MKKILTIVLAAGAMLTSCSLDELEPGKLSDQNAIQTADDCLSFRNGLYSSLRIITSGAYVTPTELEADYFVGILGNGNRGMDLSTATITSASSDVDALYTGCYSIMKNVNFLIEHAEALLDGGSLTDQDAIDVKRYIGEAHFVRAYLYSLLFDRYCQTYDTSKADQEGLGLSLVTVYAPTGDTSKYPGRSTMNEAIELINSDLAVAYDNLKAYEATDGSNLAPNASYISSMTVAAQQARVALWTKDYTTAAAKANEVINSNYYSLTTGDDYIDMWYTDSGSELIFVPFVDQSESSSVYSFNDTWNYYANFPTRIDYIPTIDALDLYGDGDIRFDAFFGVLYAQVQGSNYGLYYFAKFPGNTSLISGTDMYKNKPKPYRLSEQYLIVAEAEAALGHTENACKALNTLRAARIDGYEDVSIAGSDLVNAVREERAKELIGEGFRLSDLHRWGLGFSRNGDYSGINPNVNDIIIPSTANVSFSATDYRYVWPIPSSEMEINPQLKGQQNPGY